MRVLVSPEVRSYLYELSLLLYEKDYFGFLESAERYVEELFTDITTTLPYRLKRPAPPYFQRYGKKLLYATFTKNKTTQWYVFFNVDLENNEIVYLVRYISINHMIAHLFSP